MVALSGNDHNLWLNLLPTVMQEFGREPEMKRQAGQEKPLAPIQSSPSNLPGMVNLQCHAYLSGVYAIFLCMYVCYSSAVGGC